MISLILGCLPKARRAALISDNYGCRRSKFINVVVGARLGITVGVKAVWLILSVEGCYQK